MITCITHVVLKHIYGPEVILKKLGILSEPAECRVVKVLHLWVTQYLGHILFEYKVFKVILVIPLVILELVVRLLELLELLNLRDPLPPHDNLTTHRTQLPHVDAPSPKNNLKTLLEHRVPLHPLLDPRLNTLELERTTAHWTRRNLIPCEPLLCTRNAEGVLATLDLDGRTILEAHRTLHSLITEWLSLYLLTQVT